MRRLLLIGMLLGAGVFATSAEEVRPVASAWMLGAGTSHLADTYLSPVRYSGVHFGLTYSRLQAMRSLPCVQGWNLGATVDRAENPAGNATMLGARIEGGWRMMRRWRLPSGWSAGIGGYAGAEFGALYLSRNGNNPAQAVASVAIGPEGYVQWTGKIRRLPLAVRWQASTPLLGAFFCPDYGELYYEISLGNHSGLAHFAWPGSRRAVDSLLSLDLNLGRTTLRLGYRLSAVSARANNVTSRRIEHAAVLGVVCDFITVNPRSSDAKTVSAYY